MKTAFLPGVLILLTASMLAAEDAPKAFQQTIADQDPFEDNPAQQEQVHDHFDPYHHAPKAVRVQVEFISLPHLELSRLLLDYKPRSTNATDLRTKVQKLLENNQAELLETQIAVGRSGEKATSQSIQETIYPTEYNPPQTSEEDQTADADTTPLPFGQPTAFEVRNVGSTLEIEPVIGEDDKMIDLRLTPEIIWHTGNVVWQEQKDKLGNTYKVQMPNFYTVRTNTAITTHSGQYYLLGALSPSNDKGERDPSRKILLFVKGDVIATIP